MAQAMMPGSRMSHAWLTAPSGPPFLAVLDTGSLHLASADRKKFASGLFIVHAALSAPDCYSSQFPIYIVKKTGAEAKEPRLFSGYRQHLSILLLCLSCAALLLITRSFTMAAD